MQITWNQALCQDLVDAFYIGNGFCGSEASWHNNDLRPSLPRDLPAMSSVSQRDALATLTKETPRRAGAWVRAGRAGTVSVVRKGSTARRSRSGQRTDHREDHRVYVITLDGSKGREGRPGLSCR